MLAEDMRHLCQRKKGFITQSNNSSYRISNFLNGTTFLCLNTHRMKPKLPGDTCTHSRLQYRGGAWNKGIGPLFGRETLHSKAVHYIYIIEQILKNSPLLFAKCAELWRPSYSLVCCLCWIINRSFTFHISSSKSLLFLYFALCYTSGSQPFFNITLPTRCLFRHFLLT